CSSSPAAGRGRTPTRTDRPPERRRDAADLRRCRTGPHETGPGGYGYRMVEVIDRRAVQGLLVSHEAQLVEVLPPARYEWAHLPQAINLSLPDLHESAADRLT